MSTPFPPPSPKTIDASTGEGASSRVAQREDDQHLIERLLAEEPGAASRFYERIEPSVSITLSKVLGATDPDFDDLSQQALEKITTSVVRGKFAGKCSLSTWASVVTSRLAIDTLRQRRRERGLFWFRKSEEDDEPEAPTGTLHSPHHDLERSRILGALRQSLGKISPAKAEAVVLFEVMGHDLTEIAAMTGVSLAAAQSRLVRGRGELATLLKQKLGDLHGR